MANTGVVVSVALALIALTGNWLWSRHAQKVQIERLASRVRAPDILKEHSNVFSKREVIKVTENVYSAIGFALANSIMIEGKDGVVVVDVTESVVSGREVMAAFREITNKPIKAIVYTHNHADHTFGAQTSQMATKDVEERRMEKLTDIELTSIDSTDPKPRSFANTDATAILIQEDDIETPYGNMHVAIQGDRSKTAILTFHDIGLNHITCFQGFFSYSDMQPILRHFCVYHVNAPGQEEGALQLKPEFVYPSMDELAEGLHSVVEHYGLKRFIGFGVGMGANILTRYELSHPDHVDSLVLINNTATQAGWVEWGYQKMNSWYLFSGQVTNFTEEYLLWHWFGKKTRWENHDLITVYKDYIKCINPQNLALITESYLKRTDLNIVRETDPMKKMQAKTVRCRSMMIVGDDSPHIDDVVNMNGRMDPQETDFMKIADCGGMPLEEQPGKVTEAFRLFLQGMGYVPSLHQRRSIAGQVSQLHNPHTQDLKTTAVC